MTSLENKKNENQVIEAYLYASDKARLKDMVSDMGAKASDALLNAMNALRAFDLELADKVIGNDDVIDELEEQGYTGVVDGRQLALDHSLQQDEESIAQCRFLDA